MRCEACRKPGVYREDYDAVLCDTHAEIPSFGAPRIGFWRNLADHLYLAIVALPWLAVRAAINSDYAQAQR